jgi:thiol:disulfide interchange protein DsbD
MEHLISQFDTYLYGSPLLALLIAFLAGVLTSFTPCIYPLIPITVGFIGARSSANKIRGFYLSLFYVFGLSFVYASLGAFASLSGKLFGQINTNPWTYLLVGNVCVFFGLSMLDVFTLQFHFFSKWQPSLKQTKGVTTAFIFGGFSALVAGPCTTPVLGALLGYVASRQNVLFGFVMLFCFAIGMSLLLLVVGTFTGALSSLPASGTWMNRAKKCFGIFMILVGEFFIIKAGQLLV